MSVSKSKQYTLPHDHGQNIQRILEAMPKKQEFPNVAEIFHQLGDGTRLQIVWILCHCEECVSNIAAIMDMSNPAVSHHLSLLKKSGIIVSRREGKEVYYKLSQTDKARTLHQMVDAMFELTCPTDS